MSLSKNEAPKIGSIRYGGGRFDFRSAYIGFCSRLQRKTFTIYKSNLVDCYDILNRSKTKGTFLEQIFATPAWHPIYSIESVDGKLWESLLKKFNQIMGQLNSRDRIAPLVKKNIEALVIKSPSMDQVQIDSEVISRLSLQVLYELLFDVSIASDDENLFYQASIEWRKELAVKGKGSRVIKQKFWNRLETIVKQSKFVSLLPESCDGVDQDLMNEWMSSMAQPFLISPQINISDIFVSVFRYLRADSALLEKARSSAQIGDKTYLSGILLEAIRLQHPFPVLEREDPNDPQHQYFIFLDQLEQDQLFNPDRWNQKSSQNPSYWIPFGTGPRKCAGKAIAMELMRELLGAFLLSFSESQIQPEVGHRYSGRNNDSGESWRESLYQLRTFGKGAWKSYRLGKQSKIDPPQSGCPFKNMTQRFR